jgi:hypothetical protein
MAVVVRAALMARTKTLAWAAAGRHKDHHQNNTSTENAAVVVSAS